MRNSSMRIGVMQLENWLLQIVSRHSGDHQAAKHTCQPSRSHRDSPDLKTETRRPTRRPKKPIRPDLSQPTPKNHDFKPAFCLFSLFFGRNSSLFCVLWLFSCTHPWQAVSYPNKKNPYGIVLAEKFTLLSFSSEHKKLCINFRLIFSCCKCVESLTKTLKNAYSTISIFKIFRGSMPPDPPRKARASPSQ